MTTNELILRARYLRISIPYYLEDSLITFDDGVMTELECDKDFVPLMLNAEDLRLEVVIDLQEGRIIDWTHSEYLRIDYEGEMHICIFKIPAAVNRPIAFTNEEYVRIGSTTRKLRDFPQKEAKIWRGVQKPLDTIKIKEKLSADQIFALLSYETYFDISEKMTNQTLRDRMGIDKQNYPMASKIIKDTILAKKIKEEKTEKVNRRNQGYIPYWA